MRIGHLYAQYMSITILVAEGVMLLMVLVFTGIELSTWRKMGTSNYFMEMWHWFDWTNFILFYVAFGLRYSCVTLLHPEPVFMRGTPKPYTSIHAWHS